MKLAIIGTGTVGRSLAQAFSTAGHEVVAGSRTPGAHPEFPVPVRGLPEAAEGAAVVVNATPGIDSLAALTAHGTGWLDGKILLDMANAGDAEGNLVYPNFSLAETLQQAFPGAAVVKALNTFNVSVMTNPKILPVQTTAYLSGDDVRAKAVVASLITDLGWPGSALLDLGGLRSARATEHYYPLFLATFTALDTLVFNTAVVSA